MNGLIFEYRKHTITPKQNLIIIMMNMNREKRKDLMQRHGGAKDAKLLFEKLDSQSNAQSSVEFLYFRIRERADVIGKQGFREADQIIAINSAIVFEPFSYTYLNLSGNISIISTNRSAYYSRELRINQHLSGNNQINAIIFWVIFISLVNSIKFASFHLSSSSHNGTWYERFSMASLLSHSMFLLIHSISSSSVTLGFVLDLAGVKVRITGPVGTSRGTVIRRSAGISMV